MSYKQEQFCKLFVTSFFGAKFFSFPGVYKIRNYFYRKSFNIGDNPIIENNVIIHRTHGLAGIIRIGSNVLLAKNVSIDYSGEVIIEDQVWLSAGVEIQSHFHTTTLDRTTRDKSTITPTKIILREGCWLGTNVIVLPTVQEIGKNSIIGAGSVVTKDVPENVVVAGNPARIIKRLDF